MWGEMNAQSLAWVVFLLLIADKVKAAGVCSVGG
jgi:hypothetical protein